MNRRQVVALSLLIVSAVLGCAGASTPEPVASNASTGPDSYEEAPQREVPYDFDAPPAAALTNLAPDSKWWADPEPCPAGSELVGGVPPEHQQVGCRTPQGKSVGRFTAFHPSGAKKEEGEYDNHLAVGVWVIWDEAGRRMSETPYFGGRKDGVETEYFPSGTIESQHTYRAGKRHGLTTIWDDRERKRTILTYEDGKKHGLEARYDIEGELARVIEWHQGSELTRSARKAAR